VIVAEIRVRSMPRPRDVESVIADYLGQFGGRDPDGGPGPEAAGLIRWLADEGWVLVTVTADSGRDR
jgi:hypothetical protein